jgi:hypothetical protein
MEQPITSLMSEHGIRWHAMDFGCKQLNAKEIAESIREAKAKAKKRSTGKASRIARRNNRK